MENAYIYYPTSGPLLTFTASQVLGRIATYMREVRGHSDRVAEQEATFELRAIEQGFPFAAIVRGEEQPAFIIHRA